MIYIFRNPFDLIISWNKRKLYERLGKDQRQFTLMIEKKKKKFYLDFKNTVKHEKYNNMEACASYVYHTVNEAIKNYNKLGKKMKKNIFITTYQRVSQNQKNEIKKIAKFLNSKTTNNTLKVIKKEKLFAKDRKKYQFNLKKRKEFIKSKISIKTYYKLIEQEKNLNLDT